MLSQEYVKNLNKNLKSQDIDGYAKLVKEIKVTMPHNVSIHIDNDKMTAKKEIIYHSADINDIEDKVKSISKGSKFNCDYESITGKDEYISGIMYCTTNVNLKDIKGITQKISDISDVLSKF